MSNAKHTPGPWVVDHYNTADATGYVLISTANDERKRGHHIGLAQVVWSMEDDCMHGERSHECEANGRLIAAAPELLEALEAWEKAIPRIDEFASVSPDSLRGKALAAIAKARGE